jgi:hypothetical protein
MCDEKDDLNKKLTEKHLELEEKMENLEESLKIWTDAITELSEIEDAFKTSEKPEMRARRFWMLERILLNRFILRLNITQAKS